MDLRIGVIGAEGKFGKAIADLHPVFPVLRHTSRKNLPCDVLIDVSSKEALLENLSAQLPLVVGTTGHEDLSLLEMAAQHLPIFYAPNFSLGIALLRKLTAETARLFPADIDIIETHHKMKKDAPSGTALLLAKAVPNATLHSIRAGEIIGEHTVAFTAMEERITLKHEAFGREAFARGALTAARFLCGKPPGLYTMESLLS
jgi:4-hydroxy-tetrahydrodipicolinate reductase